MALSLPTMMLQAVTGVWTIGLGEVIVLAVSLALFVALPLALVVLLLRSTRGRNAAHASSSEEEAQLLQDIYQGLSRMDARVESLETILLDRDTSADESSDTRNQRRSGIEG